MIFVDCYAESFASIPACTYRNANGYKNSSICVRLKESTATLDVSICLRTLMLMMSIPSGFRRTLMSVSMSFSMPYLIPSVRV